MDWQAPAGCRVVSARYTSSLGLSTVLRFCLYQGQQAQPVRKVHLLLQVLPKWNLPVAKNFHGACSQNVKKCSQNVEKLSWRVQPEC